jgi:hypothetical protein
MGKGRHIDTVPVPDVAGDDPVRFRRRWVKPRKRYWRCNRQRLVTQEQATTRYCIGQFQKPVELRSED